MSHVHGKSPVALFRGRRAARVFIELLSSAVEAPGSRARQRLSLSALHGRCRCAFGVGGPPRFAEFGPSVGAVRVQGHPTEKRNAACLRSPLSSPPVS